MSEKILNKDQIGKFYSEFSEYNFYAPVNEKDNIVFRKVLKPEDIILEFLNSKVPPKEILLKKGTI